MRGTWEDWLLVLGVFLGLCLLAWVFVTLVVAPEYQLTVDVVLGAVIGVFIGPWAVDRLL